jgi:hypothetical protein
LITDKQLEVVRPSRSNRGKGGAIAQLQAVSDRLHTGTQRVKKPGNKVLQDVAINKMAPPKTRKGRRTVESYIILLPFYSNVSVLGEA